jgi:hypothetical protein
LEGGGRRERRCCELEGSTYKPLSNSLGSFGADPSAAAVGEDVGIEGDDEETLLGRVEEVNEEVTWVFVSVTRKSDFTPSCFQKSEYDQNSNL